MAVQCVFVERPSRARDRSRPATSARYWFQRSFVRFVVVIQATAAAAAAVCVSVCDYASNCIAVLSAHVATYLSTHICVHCTRSVRER